MDNDSHLRETALSRAELLRGKLLHVVRDTVRLPSGAEATREYVLHPGAVMVIALLDDGRVVLERQYRHPLQQVMIEFPAGKLDAGEASLACARRELLEETGYSAREWAFAGRLAPTISYSTEIIDIWFARGLTLGERQLDEGEHLDVFTAALPELQAWCRNGEVIDGKTLAGTMWLQNVLHGTWSLDWSQDLGASAGEGTAG
ncbi:NUDIX hydrolase [Hydrogenophaga taeniospiralis CCUG 15921]|uniref:GDP-mannose pyrophosphatase n=1 Tax=Hydrogenophaga taeniospiralis CCUG 15921 TaxID=1281780 RepID=A0A9X4S9V0_9BURK|nr:NUDIX hydrolase [Hydrogenophaga taeniospiralis]MDG5977165.1 NUDIX hydrolase [Hydrogenophaga taeniospiralis CCUG 15921]